MSEGDAVHRAARRIELELRDQVIREAVAPNPRSGLANAISALRGRRLIRSEARGKHLLLHFEGGWALHSHLGMSGGWHVYRRGQRWRRSQQAAWLRLSTDRVDVVQFGGPTLELVKEGRLRLDRRLRALGPDVLADDFTIEAGVASLRRADGTRELGDALLDQTILAGIGNIYKSEACFAAGISPWRRLSDLNDENLVAVVQTAHDQMRHGLETGRMPRRIYRQAGRPCPRCGTTLQSRGQGDANRTTYWCPGCQL